MSSLRQQIETYWRTYRPAATAQLDDPDRFFQQMTAQVKKQVRDLTDELAGPDPENEDFTAKVGRLQEAQKAATEKALHDVAFLPKEPGTEDKEPEQVRVPGVAYVD